MATKPRHEGKRLTEQRVSELHAAIGELRGYTEARLERLERAVSAIAELPVEMARAQAGAVLSLLQRDRDLPPPHPDEPREP